ncbi:MAG TPA: hypothetical protein HPP58_05115, partial [Deltaproteobacteria bacterium]|nr:hypothetical protein [Deltaproteobacteria bacterium]
MGYREEIKDIFSHVKGRLRDHADMGFDPPSLPRDLVDFLDRPSVSTPKKEEALPRDVPSKKTAS